MQITKNYVLGLTLAFTLMACGKDEKTKTVTVDNPKTAQALKEVEKERDALREQVKQAGNSDELKAELEKANASIAELDKEIAAKKTEIEQNEKDLEKALKELEEAKKAGNATAELDAKVKDLEKQKGDLTKELEGIKADKAGLEAKVEAAKGDEELFKKLIKYAVEAGAKDVDAIGGALDKELKSIDKKLQDLAAKEPGLKAAITAQAQLVVKAAEKLDHVSKNMKSIHDALTTRAANGEKLTDAEKASLEVLKAYYEAAQAEATEKTTKEGLEQAIDQLNKEITELNTTLAAAEGELAKFNDELLALVLNDPKLESPRAKELTKLIAERKDKIAQATKAKTGKTKTLGEKNTQLTKTKEKIEALVNTQEQKLTAYRDSDVLAAREALTASEKELEKRVTAYQNSKNAATAAQDRKTDLTTLKGFYERKVKPAQG